MTRPTDTVKSNEDPGAARTARGVDHDARGVDHMMDVTSPTPVLVEHPKCPRCGTTGWASALTTQESTAVCGTRWMSTTLIVTAAGPACYVIEAKNDRIEELEHALADLREAALAAA